MIKSLLLNLLLIVLFSSCSKWFEVKTGNGQTYIKDFQTEIIEASVDDWKVGKSRKQLVSKGFKFKIKIPKIKPVDAQKLYRVVGVDSYILKPYNLETVTRILNRAIQDKHFPSDYLKKVQEGKKLLFSGKIEESVVFFNEAIDLYALLKVVPLMIISCGKRKGSICSCLLNLSSILPSAGNIPALLAIIGASMSTSIEIFKSSVILFRVVSS